MYRYGTRSWYHCLNSGGEKRQVFNKHMPEKWQIRYCDIVFNVHPTGSKQTGLFPEQAVNWGVDIGAYKGIRTSYNFWLRFLKMYLQ